MLPQAQLEEVLSRPLNLRQRIQTVRELLRLDALQLGSPAEYGTRSRRR
jgi:hypothetical protein